MANRSMSGNFFSKLLAIESICLCLIFVVVTSGCEVERRRSDAELGLTPQQASGRHIYDQQCDRCHAPYSTRGRKGPSLKDLFKQQYLPKSGMPANDQRVGDIIRLGRGKMEGFEQILTQQQIDDLLAYLHTL
jgi:mono/diheme cytochrome c family protein